MTTPSRQVISSPRAADRVAAGRTWTAALPPAAEAVVIAPSQEAADDLVRTLGMARGAHFGIHRLTFGRLIGLLAAERMATAGLAPAAGLAAEAVAARAAFRLKDSPEVAWFRPVLDRPGFPGALARTLAELRLSRVMPAALARVAGPGPALAAMLQQFETELGEAKLLDRAGMLEVAIATIAQPHCRFAGLPTLLLDVAIESASERDFVAAIAARAPSLMVTVPADDVRTREFISDALDFTGAPCSLACESQWDGFRGDAPSGAAAANVSNGAESDSLARLQQYLFADVTPSERALDESVVLLSAAGEMQECVEIARRIQVEASRGVAFDRIAVLLHDPERYAPYLAEALDRAGIPAYFARGTARPEPGGRALLALLRCAAENLSARRFAEYLSLAQVPDGPNNAADEDRSEASSFVTPDNELVPGSLRSSMELAHEAPSSATLSPDPVPVVEGTVRAPWRWERLLVDAAVIGSRERWETRLKGLEAELKLKRAAAGGDDAYAASLDRQLIDLAHLREVAIPIIDALAMLPMRAAWAQWLDHLRPLVDCAVRDRNAVLAALGEIDPMGPVGPVTLDEVRIVLADRLGRLEDRPKRRRYGRVFVAPTGHARGLEFDLTIIPGLAERVFPKKLTEDPILPDAVRQLTGLNLTVQSNRVAAERLALRIAVGAARRATMLSYPRVDLDQGRPRVPSFYALEVLRAAEGRLPGFDELARRAAGDRVARLGWPAPARPADAIDDIEFDLAVLDKLVDADPETTIGAANYLLGGNPHLARALRARARRWLRLWTPNDGLVDPDRDERAALARHQLDARSYSPTALQNFAACPYRFFLQAIHRLEPREEVEAIEVIDPLTRGALFHEVQFELLTALRIAGMLPVTRENLDRSYAVAEQKLEAVAAYYHDELAPAIERVWEAGIDSIRADLREWLRRASDDSAGWRPERFELAFGLADRAQADPKSVADAVEVGDGLRLRGSIDLVERAADGKLRVTDHKTGRVRAGKHLMIGGGKTLQPLLYGLAAERVLGQAVEAGRLYYCTAVGGYEECVVEFRRTGNAILDPAAIGALERDVLEVFRATARERIDDATLRENAHQWVAHNVLERTPREVTAQFAGVIGAALAEGFLPAAPDRDECRFCDYRRVCGPYEQDRLSHKPEWRLKPLKLLRLIP